MPNCLYFTVHNKEALDPKINNKASVFRLENPFLYRCVTYNSASYTNLDWGMRDGNDGIINNACIVIYCSNLSFDGFHVIDYILLVDC